MVTIRNENMNCSDCAKDVTATLEAESPTTATRVDLERHKVTVDAPDALPRAAALIADSWKAAAVASSYHLLCR